MTQGSSVHHLDEGTIHAWLDGALSDADARAAEAHVAGCAQCAAAVAEARGLIAAASRILVALDDVPAGVLPERNAAVAPPAAAAVATTAAGVTSLDEARVRHGRRRPGFRVTPVRAAAAAVLIAAVGTSVVVREVSREEAAPRADTARVTTAVLQRAAGPRAAEEAMPASATATAAPPVAPPAAAVPAPSVAEQGLAARARDAAAPSRTATPVPYEIAASAAPTAPPPPPSADVARRLNRASVRDDAPSVAGGSVATGAAAKAAPSAAIGNVASDAMVRERAVTSGAVAAAPSMMQAAPRRVAVVVVGYVYEADSRRPIDGAQVRVVGAGLGALSDSTGRYAIASVAPGSRVVEARRIGYQARSSTVTVSADADTAIGPDFPLASAATTLSAVRVDPRAARAAERKAAKSAERSGTEVVSGLAGVAPSRVSAGCYDLSASPSSLGLPPRIVLDTTPSGAVRAPAGATPLGYARAYWREPATAGDSVIVYLLDGRDAGVAVRARVDASSGRLRGTASLVEPGRPDVALSGAVVGARCGGTPR